MSLLEVRDVSVRFGGVRALDSVSLTVEPGEVHGLIGPNGSGKTTLLNVVTGFVKAAGGTITFDGRRIDNLPTHRRAKLGLSRAFQNAASFDELDLLENVRIGRHSMDRRTFWKACLPVANERLAMEEVEVGRGYLERVGLASAARRLSGYLSYGDRKMLDFARAHASSPKLVLLDEPAAGLNNAETTRLMDLIKECQREGTTVLLIEHHMGFVMGLCDRITVLDFGKVIANGTAVEVRENEQVIEAYLGVRHQ